MDRGAHPCLTHFCRPLPVDSVRVLLEAGANPNAKNRLMGSTPLHMVAQSHKASLDDALRVVDLLRAHGADVSVPDDQGSVPVSAVVDPSKEALRDRLLPRRPPVFEAIASTNPDDAQAAVAGDPGCVNITFMGLTPVGGAIERLLAAAEAKDDARLPGALAVLQLLVEGGGRLVADTGTPSIATDWTDVPPLSQTLEALRLSPKAHPPSTPVLREAVLLLVKAGAPVTADDRECLHRAARRNDLEMARFMVERMNVDPNTRGPGGMTPLHVSVGVTHSAAGTLRDVLLTSSIHPSISLPWICISIWDPPVCRPVRAPRGAAISAVAPGVGQCGDRRPRPHGPGGRPHQRQAGHRSGIGAYTRKGGERRFFRFDRLIGDRWTTGRRGASPTGPSCSGLPQFSPSGSELMILCPP